MKPLPPPRMIGEGYAIPRLPLKIQPGMAIILRGYPSFKVARSAGRIRSFRQTPKDGTK